MEKNLLISRIDEDISAISTVDLVNMGADTIEETKKRISNLQTLKYLLQQKFEGQYRSDKELFTLVNTDLWSTNKRAANSLKSGIDRESKVNGLLLSNYNKSLELLKLWKEYIYNKPVIVN